MQRLLKGQASVHGNQTRHLFCTVHILESLGRFLIEMVLTVCLFTLSRSHHAGWLLSFRQHDGVDAQQFVAQNFTAEGAEQRREQMDFFTHQQRINRGGALGYQTPAAPLGVLIPESMTSAATHIASSQQSNVILPPSGPVPQSNGSVHTIQPGQANRAGVPPSSRTWSSSTPAPHAEVSLSCVDHVLFRVCCIRDLQTDTSHIFFFCLSTC